MEIKILCPCGAKFKFDVEPVNGQSPGPVQCPACGRDSTEATNAQIRERLPAAAPVASIPRISVVAPTVSAPPIQVSAVSAVAPSSASPAEPKPAGSPKMAFMPVPAPGSGSSLSVSGAQTPPAPAAASGHTPPPPPPITTHPAAAKMVRPERPKSAGSFGMGVTGAVIGCLVGAGIWYFLTLNVIEGWRILAWIPGIVGGFCAVQMGRQRSEKLGIAAAVVAAIITIATQFVVISAINDKRLTEASEAHYKEQMAFAKKAADAKTDAQIRELIEEDPQNNGFEARSFREAIQQIAKMAEKAEREEAAKASGAAATPEEADEIAKYRSKRLPELVKFSKGEPTRTRFLEQERARLEEDGEILYRKGWFWMGIWIASSVEAAFLLGRGKKKE